MFSACDSSVSMAGHAARMLLDPVNVYGIHLVWGTWKQLK